MKFERVLESIRVKALDSQPFWGLVAMRLEIIVTSNAKGNSVPTAATDGRSLYCNEEYGRSLSPSMLKSLILHEVAHVALGHQLRRGNRDQHLFNIACDYVINLLLKDANYEIPSSWYCDDKYRGWSEERIYADLVSNPPPPDKGDTPEPVGLGGDPSSDPPPPGGDPSPPGGEPPPPGEVWDATHEDGSDLSDAERAEELETLSDDIRQASRVAGESDNADVKRAVDRIINPKLDWSTFLAKWITAKGRPIGRSWSRLDRRALARKAYVPDEIREGLDWLVVAVDISGSVGQDELQAFLSHLEKIRKGCLISRISLVPFNSTIQQHGIVEISPKDKLPTNIGSGGGTAFAPIFHWLKRQRGRPNAIIVFTDLGSNRYGTAPNVPLLWASSDEVYSGTGWTNKPPFGDVVQIDIHS